MKRVLYCALALAMVLTIGLGTASARDQIRIVGSSTVFPFASYVAEEFGATTDYPTPVIESTGSGGGMKLFSQGVGLDTPDISNASRQIKVSEFKRCQENGVEDIVQVVIGYDGIAIAHNIDNPELALTREELTLAVAAEVPQDGKLVKNPYTHWDQINGDLPNREILVYGPPTSSGTRDAFEELVMEAASEDIDGYGGEYTKIRQDGVYVPAGENDNLIVQKLDKNTEALGIFGYSFLEENSDRIQGALIDGVAPKPAAISSGEYPVSRSLFFYVKKAHLGEVDGMEEYVDLFLSEKMIGDMGYLKGIGLIPLPKEEREAQRANWENRNNLQLSDIQ
ncbi:PstS family phosphate ABC transporter substrate-binding protein [Desulfohalobium retbaense]|uniref:Periplasmic phosphate binding protein n=1 Tax=Desulfohalobium retbaense (strain ATCC 49708 / DSM 5692 / JCM 16813 / HR100) TaxID=485915 RepID=C8X0D6_DESRD|nr:PstS family phosphate ABC transporter substrate-binding protein [Desulfohalobium retbaense]ACV67761.1 periplasmic phosphate binding protein [Desulfohalobium retbaense DSM 5692]